MDVTDQRIRTAAILVIFYAAVTQVVQGLQKIFFSFSGTESPVGIFLNTIIPLIICSIVSYHLYRRLRYAYWVTVFGALVYLVLLTILAARLLPEVIQTFMNTPFMFDQLSLSYYLPAILALFGIIILGTIITLLLPTKVRQRFS